MATRSVTCAALHTSLLKCSSESLTKTRYIAPVQIAPIDSRSFFVSSGPLTIQASTRCPFAEGPKSDGPKRPSASAAAAEMATSKPLREIPGGYGPPILGPLRDKLDYFAFKGWYKYIQEKKDKYKSTVIRVNWPRFNDKDSQVVLLLDQASYPILYDNAKVDKTNLFFGPYRPDLGYTDGMRILAYLDTTEEAHTKAKKYCTALLAKYSGNALGAINERAPELFASWETQIQKNGVAEAYDTFYEFVWAYLVTTFNFTSILPNGGHLAKDWVGPQLLPIINLGAPAIVEALVKLLLPPLPPFIVKSKLTTLLDYFKASGREAINLGKEFGLTEHESAVHFFYFVSFNAHGAIVGLWASILTAIALFGGKPLMNKLSEEVRAAAAAHGNGQLTREVLDNLPLLDSVIYETLRMEPPIAVQHARAREDLIIESHDAKFEVKKGQIIAGHAAWPMRDPVIFKDPETFIPDRFMGDGKQLLRYLLWSNGRQTSDVQGTVATKQCPGKDFVPDGAKIFLANLFIKYKAYELTGDVGWSSVKVVPGPGLKEMKLGTQKLLFKSLQRA